MNCKYCNYQNDDKAQTCINCGRPIEREQPKVELVKINKTLKDTGTSVVVIGWLNAVTNVGLYIWSIFDKNYLESGMPKIDTTGVMIMLVFSVLFIILGKRIQKLTDINIKRYLWVLLGICLIIVAWLIPTGGKIGLLFFLVMGYIIVSLVKVTKALKSEDYKATLVPQQYKIKKTGWIAFSILSVLLVAAAFGVDVYRIKNGTYTGLSKSQVIESTVKQVKSQTSLPKQTDQYTTWVDITAEPNAILYHYKISGLTPDQLSQDALRSGLLNVVCSNKDIKPILNMGISLEYSYVFDNSPQTILLAVNKSDCPQD